MSQSGLPITRQDVGQFLDYVSRVIQRRYRTTATQARTKITTDNERDAFNYLVSAPKRPAYRRAMEAIRPLLRGFTLGEVLYREYRSGAIHEYGFGVDDRFFVEHGLYVGTIKRDIDEARFLEVRVSASWLLKLFESSVESYRSRLLATRRLPLPMFLELCDVMAEGSYLDEALLEEGRELTIPVDR